MISNLVFNKLKFAFFFTFLITLAQWFTSDAIAFSRKQPRGFVKDSNRRSVVRPVITAPGEKKITILTYNIQGFPPPLADDPFRLIQIGNELRKRRLNGTAPDIVGIQEAWVTPATNVVNQIAGYPVQLNGPAENLRAGKGTGSGLVLLSEYLHVYRKDETYTDCANVDCLSNKGIQYVEFQIPEVPYPVIVTNTHQNASYENESLGNTVQARVRQQTQGSQFFRKNELSWAPAFLIGDFNHIPNTFDYDHFSGLFPEFVNSLENCGRNPLCHGSNQILNHWVGSLDHHYSRGGLGMSVEILEARTVFTEVVNGRPLSDHYGVEVDYLLKW